MTAHQFKDWLAAMESAGRIRDGHGSIQDVANALGLSREQVRKFMRDGTKQIQTDYACAAILAGIGPYPSGASGRD